MPKYRIFYRLKIEGLWWSYQQKEWLDIKDINSVLGFSSTKTFKGKDAKKRAFGMARKYNGWTIVQRTGRREVVYEQKKKTTI